MTFLACVVSAVAALCVYLASDQQRLTRAKFHWSWRIAGFVLAGLGIWLWTSTTSVAASIFAALTVWMTAFVVLPYISWVRQPLPDTNGR
jgi:hypothetical protein